MSLHEKLLNVKKSVDYLQKDASGKQYNYVSSSQVLGTIRDAMNEQKILLIPEIRNAIISQKEEKKADGKITITYFTELFMTMTWVDVEKPEDNISVEWYGQGVDIAGEKGVGKALTYAEKYYILKFFNIPTDKDDPDSFQKKYEKPVEKSKGNIEEFKNKILSAKDKKQAGEIYQTLSNYVWTEKEKIEIQDAVNELLQKIADEKLQSPELAEKQQMVKDEFNGEVVK